MFNTTLICYLCPFPFRELQLLSNNYTCRLQNLSSNETYLRSVLAMLISAFLSTELFKKAMYIIINKCPRKIKCYVKVKPLLLNW